MIKKTITYDDFEGNSVSEDFYFHMSKLEMVEKDLELGGMEETIKRLSATQDAKEAYGIFKQLILGTVGKKSDDGRRFIKTEELRRDFEQSPACDELIIEFLKDPNQATAFIEGILPSKLIAEVKASEAATVTQLPTAPPVLATDDAVDLDNPDFDAMLAEMEEDPGAGKIAITQHQHDFMRSKLSDKNFAAFMATRYVSQ